MTWRPVAHRLWDDRRFLACTDTGRLLWLFLLTCPTLPIPGLILGGDAALAEQLGWDPERVRDGFQELLRNGLRVRREGRITWVQNALKYQSPSGPNAIKCWGRFWGDVPEGALKHELWQALKIACKSWSKLFAERFPEPLPDGFAEPLPEPFRDGLPPQAQALSQAQALALTGESPPSPGPDTGPRSADPELALRQGARALLWLELERTRQAVAAELGVEARPLAVHDPGERELACRLVEAGPGQLESAVDNARHVIAVAATEARRKRTVQWLTGAMFEARPWRRALGMTIADADRPDPKARPPGPPNAGRVEPHAPRDYGSGDIEL